MADFGPTTTRTGQKAGAWTKKKLRERRRRQEEERNAATGPRYVRGRIVMDKLPHQMRDD